MRTLFRPSFRRPPGSDARWRPSFARRLARRPWLWWAAAALAALFTLLSSQRMLGDASAAKQRWGETEPVVVTTVGVSAGEPVGPHNTQVINLPKAALPQRFLTMLGSGSVAATAMGEGEIISPSRMLSPGNTDATRVAVAIPTGVLADLVRIGDVVDVWISDDPYAVAPNLGSNRRVVVGAAVIDLADSTALLAINATEVDAVTASLPYGLATLTIVGRSVE